MRVVSTQLFDLVAILIDKLLERSEVSQVSRPVAHHVREELLFLSVEVHFSKFKLDLRVKSVENALRFSQAFCVALNHFFGYLLGSFVQ